MEILYHEMSFLIKAKLPFSKKIKMFGFLGKGTMVGFAL